MAADIAVAMTDAAAAAVLAAANAVAMSPVAAAAVAAATLVKEAAKDVQKTVVQKALPTVM